MLTILVQFAKDQQHPPVFREVYSTKYNIAGISLLYGMEDGLKRCNIIKRSGRPDILILLHGSR